MIMVNLPVLSVVGLNLLLTIVVIVNAAATVRVARDRPAVVKSAVFTIVLAAVYAAIFAHRLMQTDLARPPGWLGELGNAAAPFAFYMIWYRQLRMVRVHLEKQPDAIRRIEQAERVATRAEDNL